MEKNKEKPLDTAKGILNASFIVIPFWIVVIGSVLFLLFTP